MNEPSVLALEPDMLATDACERMSPKRARMNFELAGVASVPNRMGAMPCQTQQPGPLGQPLAALFF